MAAYYNEIEPYAAEWLRSLIKSGLIADGEVDERSIVDVNSDELRGFTQCHFFAGIGGWSYALRLAGWPDDRPIWTGSCPCQPFSVAGKGLGTDDARHLWPHFFRLIRSARPPVVMGEQVAGAAGYGWFDGVAADLENENYASRAVDVPACSVDAPHIRSRLYWVAARDVDHADDTRLEGHAGNGGDGRGRAGAAGSVAATGGGHMADADVAYEGDGQVQWRGQQRGSGGDPATRDCSDMADASRSRHGEHERNAGAMERAPDCSEGAQSKAGRLAQAARNYCERNSTFWSDHIWLTGADGKARRAQPGLPLLAHGVSARVGRLRAYGNAIVPQVAAEVISAFMETQQ